MKHAIIIRFYYNDSEIIKSRLPYLILVIECLKKQTIQDFELILLVKNESELIRKTLNYPYKEFSNIDDIREYCKKENIQIQTRHDSDDLFVDNYIEVIQMCYKANEPHSKPMLLHFNYKDFDIDNFKILNRVRMFNKNFTSGFQTLFTDNNDLFVYDKQHQLMGQEVERIINFPVGYVFYSQHQHQVSRDINKEKYFKK